MWLLIMLLIPNLVFADWDCSKKYQIRPMQTWALFFDINEATDKVEKYHGTMTVIKDVNGQIAYRVDYRINVVADQLFSESFDCKPS